MTEQQRAAIHVDPVTGDRSFDTRASRPGRAITGAGYGITTDESLKVPSPDGKIVKYRVHLDLNPDLDASAGQREAEIERLIALGPRRVDVGQRGDET